MGSQLDQQTFSLGAYTDSVQASLARMAKEDFGSRLWRKDASLWKKGQKDQQGIPEAMGWLEVAATMADRVAELTAFAQEVRQAGLGYAIHMGMGGSSLAPLVLRRTFTAGPQGLPLTVLDTTDAATISQIEHQAPVDKTLFIVASKSGTTAEPLAYMDYFYAKVKELKGKKAGENFAVITDPGTPLTQTAKDRGFRHAFLN
ncbi:MAG TPA: hypothetical protein VE082_07085, partial [Desulfobaccales bacterium]|nr:hypothetical protein [Desulfobaccales bacterium]